MYLVEHFYTRLGYSSMRRFAIGYIIFTVFVLAIDTYVFQAVRTAVRDSSDLTKKITYAVYWGFTIFALLSVYSTIFFQLHDWPKGLRNVMMGSITVVYSAKLFVIVFLLIDDIQRFFRWVFSLFTPAGEGPESIGRAKFLSQAGLLVATFPLVAGLWGVLKGAHDYKIHRVKVKLANLPAAFHGLKIVQLSDIHSGSFPSQEPLKKAISMINAEQPDLIFFTGDLVNNVAEEVLPFVPLFSQMKAKIGKYSVFGNHDYGDYAQWNSAQEKVANLNTLKKAHADMGWRLLWDEHVYLEKDGEKIALIGIQNSSAKNSFKTYGDLDKACLGCEAPVKLLLSHDPSFWDAKIRSKEDIDITFAGHTHGAQLGIEMGGIRWSPAQYIYEQWAGLYQKGKQYIYVNRGFGYLGFPGRVGILPEITVMELEKA